MVKGSNFMFCPPNGVFPVIHARSRVRFAIQVAYFRYPRYISNVDKLEGEGLRIANIRLEMADSKFFCRFVTGPIVRRFFLLF